MFDYKSSQCSSDSRAAARRDLHATLTFNGADDVPDRIHHVLRRLGRRRIYGRRRRPWNPPRRDDVLGPADSDRGVGSKPTTWLTPGRSRQLTSAVQLGLISSRCASACCSGLRPSFRRRSLGSRRHFPTRGSQIHEMWCTIRKGETSAEYSSVTAGRSMKGLACLTIS
jgi:hypothetical protein